MAGGVLVLHLSVEEVRHCLESAMRMIGRADGLARRVVDRSHLVEEQEGIEVIEDLRREGPAHPETSALESADAGEDLFD